MRIALVSPLFESVPPKLYGGTERVVAYLADALLELGYDVTMFASGDSVTRANLRPVCAEALRLNPRCRDSTPHHILQLEMVAAAADEFDVIHFHTDLLHFPLARRLATPSLTTLHGRLDHSDIKSLYREFREQPLVSISDHQRQPLAFAHWLRTIHHGLPPDLLSYQPKSGNYLAFLGRISREKRVDRAIEIARRAGKKLKVAAKVDEADAAYYQEVSHLLAEPHVEFVGEISEAQKSDFLGGAEALLFPIDWPEPFGLVMIEALAAGTPVIACPEGAVPEIVRDGENGFLINSVAEGVRAVENISLVSRERCRADFVERFTAQRMAEDYVKAYTEVKQKRRSTVVPLASPEFAWKLG